ncbi:unnamed protein product [Gongylonema pulchrum]|uniref:DUF19 domain-containing protein n=1 Tax=Gongylonema pulchrum TaxID=637853 RepID=A0A183D6J1_9BILA|nr:unnamed protein product [Gongylonema pulchrum]
MFVNANLVEDRLRKCKCGDDLDCQNQALDALDKCATKCGQELFPLGGDVQDMVNCFGDQRAAIQAEDNCFRKKINYRSA